MANKWGHIIHFQINGWWEIYISGRRAQEIAFKTLFAALGESGEGLSNHTMQQERGIVFLALIVSNIFMDPFTIERIIMILLSLVFLI